MTVNERIKQRRKELDLSADEISAYLNIARATYFRYESKDIEKVPISVLVPLAKVLRTNPCYLMGWTEDKSINFQCATIDITVTEQEQSLLKKYRQLDSANQEDVDDYISMKLAKQERKAEEAGLTCG